MLGVVLLAAPAGAEPGGGAAVARITEPAGAQVVGPTIVRPRVAASTPVAAVTWRAPASCPDAAGLRERIERRLERSLEDVVVGVEIDVTRTAGRYLATIDLRAVTVTNDVRTLTSKRCGELTDAVAVIVARVASEAIERRAALPSAPVPVQGAALDNEDPLEVASVVPALPPGSPPVRRWTLGARLSGMSGIGVIPRVGLGAELAVTLRHDRRMLELAGAKWMASAAQFNAGPRSKVDVDLDVVVARYGWRPYELPLRIWMGVEVGTMRGVDLRQPDTELDSGRWLAAGGGFSVAWQMTPWARLVGTTETMFAFERVRFAFADGIVAYAPSPMSVRTTCGLEVGWQ